MRMPVVSCAPRSLPSDRNRVKHCGGSVSEVAQGLGGARHLIARWIRPDARQYAAAAL
jgi:hypothetical protein